MDAQEQNFIPLTTGSVAEFYIEPMLPCIGDVDIMLHRNTWLVIPRGHPPPTQLPAEFHNYVKVLMEIIDSHLSGYVYLEVRYLLTYCPDNEKYNYMEYDRGLFMSNIVLGTNLIRHGPAVFTDNSHTSNLSADAVHCIRCLVWPPQAADWPARQRNFGWPDSAIVERVVSNGCDVVGVAHRQCRQHCHGRFVGPTFSIVVHTVFYHFTTLLAFVAPTSPRLVSSDRAHLFALARRKTVTAKTVT